MYWFEMIRRWATPSVRLPTRLTPYELIGISIEKTRWGRERKVRRVVRDAAPDIVLDTPL